MVDVSQADYDYYNAGMKKIETASSVLVSSSKYLNHSGLRELIAQEMLRRNGPDLPNTAYIPEVAQILHDLEDMPQVFALFEQEKARLPEFRTWLERRELSNFKIEEVRHCAPGTLGSVIHDFLANSGYSIDHFFQGLEVTSDYTFYLKERAYTHDIEHMITGFETNHAGELALIAANMVGFYNYFCPELAAFFNRVPTYLRAKTTLKNGFHYPEAFKVQLEAEEIGARQGRDWKYPLMLVPWRDHIDRPVEELREEFGITDVLPPGVWNYTTALSEDQPVADNDVSVMQAAE